MTFASEWKNQCFFFVLEISDERSQKAQWNRAVFSPFRHIAVLSSTNAELIAAEVT